VLSTGAAPPDWHSAEKMRRDDDLYELAIQIAHNLNPVRPGHGSCIFLHVWAGPGVPVTGCTALDKRALFEVARWLQPNAAVLVSLPRSEYVALRPAWGLP
jgi:L,D-peptidoglycan transpeptidase YkuD (ErfK/YbiS/YcfS/YnhG family)